MRNGQRHFGNSLDGGLGRTFAIWMTREQSFAFAATNSPLTWWVRSGAAADFNLKQLSHLGFLIDDSPCPRSRLNRRLDRLVVAIAVMIRTWPFGLFRTDRCGVSRADCCDAHSEVLLRTTGDPTNYIESLRLSAMSQKPGY